MHPELGFPWIWLVWAYRIREINKLKITFKSSVSKGYTESWETLVQITKWTCREREGSMHPALYSTLFQEVCAAIFINMFIKWNKTQGIYHNK